MRSTHISRQGSCKTCYITMDSHLNSLATVKPVELACCDSQQQQQQQQQQEAEQQQQHHYHEHSRRAWLRRHAVGLCIGSSTAVAAIVLLWKASKHQQPQLRTAAARPISKMDHSSSAGSSDDEVRIPLPEVVRFKEQQWFVEELEASRQGDPNAMLRLAKMYLHGQGCTQNIFIAQEWLRKARAHGIYGTLDELWAGSPSELEQHKAQMRRASTMGQAMLAHRKVTQGGIAGAGL